MRSNYPFESSKISNTLLTAISCVLKLLLPPKSCLLRLQRGFFGGLASESVLGLLGQAARCLHRRRMRRRGLGFCRGRCLGQLESLSLDRLFKEFCLENSRRKRAGVNDHAQVMEENFCSRFHNLSSHRSSIISHDGHRHKVRDGNCLEIDRTY